MRHSPNPIPARLAPFLLVLTTALAPAQAPILALDGLDPVALCRGQETRGAPDRTARHFLYEYRFANDENRATFAADPERWCIQMGGGCARMGPLSGRGAPDRFLVHDGRIYIFASDACRDGFARDPQRFVLPVTPPVEVDDADDAVRKGRDAVLRAVARHGGEARLRSVRNLRLERRTTTPAADGPRVDVWRQTVAPPGRIRRDQAYGKHRYVTIATGESGFSIGADGSVQPLHASAIAELRAQALRHPVLLLRRLVEPGAEAVRVDTDVVDGRPVDLVWVRVGDLTTTLAIASDDGTIVQQRRTDRGPQLWFGDLTVTYDDFTEVGGLLLPFTQRTSFDGGDARTTRWDDVEVDVDLPADSFARPVR